MFVTGVRSIHFLYWKITLKSYLIKVCKNNQKNALLEFKVEALNVVKYPPVLLNIVVVNTVPTETVYKYILRRFKRYISSRYVLSANKQLIIEAKASLHSQYIFTFF